MIQKYPFAVQSCKYEVRKAKTSLELNLARDVNSKKLFYKYMNSKVKTKEGVSLLLIRAGALVTNDTEKTEVLNVFVPQSLSVKGFFRNPKSLRPDTEKVWNKEVLHSVKEVKVRALKLDLPNHLPVVLVKWEGMRGPEVSLCDPHLQEGSEGGSRKLQTRCSGLSAREGLEEDYLGYYNVASIGQHGDQAQAE